MANAVQDPPTSEGGESYTEELKAQREAQDQAARDAGADLPAGQPEGPGQSQVTPDGQLVIGGIGLTDLATFENGGKKATHGVLSVRGLTGLELPAGKGLSKGQFVRLELVAKVDEAGDKDKMDRKQDVLLDTLRKHSAYMVDCRLHGPVESGVLQESDAEADLRRAVAALREQGVSDDGIKGIAGLTA